MMPFASNGSVRIRYEIEGVGPPLVLQHGFTDSLTSWYDLGYVDPLKRDYMLILIDARGHGESDKPHNTTAYAMEHRVADIVSVMNELRVSRAHYFGYSMGGWIGFGMAKYAPDRLTSLIVGGADAAPRTREPHPLLEPEAMSKGAAAIQWDAPLPPALRERLLKNDMEALRASRVDDPGYEDILPTIAVPCLLLLGEADGSYKSAKTAAALIPGARFVSLPDLNHTATLLRSDLMVPHITQFLREHS
jgi:pimeloyl-ACP methyl ester carboxylesterase